VYIFDGKDQKKDKHKDQRRRSSFFGPPEKTKAKNSGRHNTMSDEEHSSAILHGDSMSAKLSSSGPRRSVVKPQSVGDFRSASAPDIPTTSPAPEEHEAAEETQQQQQQPAADEKRASRRFSVKFVDEVSITPFISASSNGVHRTHCYESARNNHVLVCNFAKYSDSAINLS